MYTFCFFYYVEFRLPHYRRQRVGGSGPEHVCGTELRVLHVFRQPHHAAVSRVRPLDHLPGEAHRHGNCGTKTHTQFMRIAK